MKAMRALLCCAHEAEPGRQTGRQHAMFKGIQVLFRINSGINLHAMLKRCVLGNWLFGGDGNTLICRVGQLSWWKYSYHRWFQATNDLTTSSQDSWVFSNTFSQTSMSQLQHTTVWRSYVLKSLAVHFEEIQLNVMGSSWLLKDFK